MNGPIGDSLGNRLRFGIVMESGMENEREEGNFGD